MPRLSHKKTRTGCQRCKARKVKCDEAKPKCSACARHDVSCEYALATPRRPGAQTPSTASPPGFSFGTIGVESEDTDVDLDGRMEIRLMHEWTAYTCNTFSPSLKFWRYQAPLIAMEHRYVLDAMFALAALNASRQSPTQWIPMDGRMVPLRDPTYNQEDAARDLSNDWKPAEGIVTTAHTEAFSGDLAYLTAKRSHEMLKNSRKYFERAIDGHRRGLDSVSLQNIEALYMTSVLVSFHALFTLSENEKDTTLPVTDPIVWLRLADGTRILCERWRTFVGDDWMKFAGVYYGVADLTEDETLRKEHYGAQFEKVLTWAEEYESISTVDRDCYERALDYIGLTYKGITKGTEHPLASCRRLVAMPSRLPKRFTELVENRSPRALTILAFGFAVMKLLAKKVPWFAGIAEQQVPRIFQKLPSGWKEMMTWPMMVTNGEIEPNGDTDVRDILSL